MYNCGTLVVKTVFRNTIVTLTLRGALLAGAAVNCSSASALARFALAGVYDLLRQHN